MEYPHPFLSIPFAILLKKEKVKSGYFLTTISPAEGLQKFFAYRNSKSFDVKNVGPLSLLELTAKLPHSTRTQPTITELSLLFSFSPPYMEFFHYCALEGLLHNNLYTLFSYVAEEMSKIFLLLLTFLQRSSEIKDSWTSYAFFLAFFFKWIGITKMHDAIFYCYFCKTRLIRNPYTPTAIWQWNKKFVCENCRKLENITPIVKFPPAYQYQMYHLLYTPLQQILNTSFQKPFLSLSNQYLETFLRWSPKEALSKKHNPFVNL